jgi:hypothetical protein
MGFSPAEAVLAALLLAAVATGLSVLAQIRRLRAGHEAFRRALGQSATVLATAEAGVRDLSVHGSQMLVALDHAIAEAREIDRSLSCYVEEVKAMPWLPPISALQQANRYAPPVAAAYPSPQSQTAAPPAYLAPAQPQAYAPAPQPDPSGGSPPAPVAPFHPAFVARRPAEPPPAPEVETLADRLKARAHGRGAGWGSR